MSQATCSSAHHKKFAAVEPCRVDDSKPYMQRGMVNLARAAKGSAAALVEQRPFANSVLFSGLATAWEGNV